MNHISIEEIINYTVSNHNGVVVDHNWGEKCVFYNPECKLPKGIYILTFKEKDGPNDKASNVNRIGVYRLNLGISKNTFNELKPLINEGVYFAMVKYPKKVKQ